MMDEHLFPAIASNKIIQGNLLINLSMLWFALNFRVLCLNVQN